MSLSIQNLTAAGALGSPIANVFPAPIISSRAPTANDKAPIGSMWVNSATQNYYVITSVIANVATWATAGNGNGIFATVEVTGGNLTIDAGNLVVTLGDVLLTNGDIGLQAGDVITAAGNIGTGNGNITTADGNISTTLGNISSVQGDIVTADGNIISSNDISAGGNFFLLTPAAGYFLESGMRITSGAGAPGNGLALQAGDMYVRSDPAGAASRLYIATGAGAWTNVTCAA